MVFNILKFLQKVMNLKLIDKCAFFILYFNISSPFEHGGNREKILRRYEER